MKKLYSLEAHFILPNTLLDEKLIKIKIKSLYFGSHINCHFRWHSDTKRQNKNRSLAPSPGEVLTGFLESKKCLTSSTTGHSKALLEPPSATGIQWTLVTSSSQTETTLVKAVQDNNSHLKYKVSFLKFMLL